MIISITSVMLCLFSCFNLFGACYVDCCCLCVCWIGCCFLCTLLPEPAPALRTLAKAASLVKERGLFGEVSICCAPRDLFKRHKHHMLISKEQHCFSKCLVNVLIEAVFR